MSPAELNELTLRYATGWGDATFARLAIGVFGAFVLLLVIRALIRKNTGAIALLLWTLLAGALLTFATIPEEVIKTIIATEYMIRVRIVMGSISLIVLLITFESVRKTRLQERYALLWVTTALVIIACVLFPDAVALFRAVTGMEYGTALASVAFTFLVLVSFHFSISFSAMNSKVAKLTQKVAILEALLREKGISAENDSFSGQRKKSDSSP